MGKIIVFLLHKVFSFKGYRHLNGRFAAILHIFVKNFCNRFKIAIILQPSFAC